MRFVSVGECMVELAPSEHSDLYAMSFAGDTFNSAWYMAQLAPGWQTDYITTVGADTLSDQLVERAARAGIGTEFIQRHPEKALGLYLIELLDGERSFHYWREASAARDLAVDEAVLMRALHGADVILISGITLAIIGEEGQARLLDCLSEVQDDGAKVAFDPNIRPRLWSDLDTMRGAIMEASLSSDIILPSFDEEAEIFGDVSPERTLDRYLSTGAKTVVVKNASGPIHYERYGDRGVVTPDPVVSVVDSTAAGDSFNAALLKGLMEDIPPKEAITLATQVSAKVIGQRGALVDLAS